MRHYWGIPENTRELPWHTDRLRYAVRFLTVDDANTVNGHKIVPAGTVVEVRACSDPRRAAARLPDEQTTTALVGASDLVSHHREDTYLSLRKANR